MILSRIAARGLSWAVGLGLLAAGALLPAYGQRPALEAPLAEQSLLLDLTRVGEQWVAVGSRGHVLLSDDGVSWRQAPVPVDVMLTAVTFIDDTRGWAVGHDGVILASEDGARSWTLERYDPEAEKPLLAVHFFDARRGLAVGGYGYYLETTDGGRTWRTVDLAERVTDERAGADEPDSQAEANPYLVWGDEEMETPTPHLNDLARADDGTLYLAGEFGTVYRSEDEGRTWSDVSVDYEGSFFTVQALDGDRVLVAGLRGTTFVTEDAGANWTSVDVGADDTVLGGLVADDGHAVLVGLNGLVLKGRPGASWHRWRQPEREGFAAVGQGGDGRLLLVGEPGVMTLDPALVNGGAKR